MTAVVTTDPTEVARCLSGGGIAAIPTETVYGLAACAQDRVAVARIYAVKNRPTDHPLIVHLSPSADPTVWGVLDDNALILAATHWPGPLTLLVPRTAHTPDWVTGGRDTVALRVPDHPLAIALLEQLDDALAAPSANTFGHVSPTTARHVLDDLGSSIDMVLDGGPCAVGLESTIVECAPSGLQILRPGSVDATQIERTTGTSPGRLTGGSRAPGTSAAHYAPRARVILAVDSGEARRVAEQNEPAETVAVIDHEDTNEYARCLYAELRQADARGATVIVAVVPRHGSLAPAIADRLSKAAAGR